MTNNRSKDSTRSMGHLFTFRALFGLLIIIAGAPVIATPLGGMAAIPVLFGVNVAFVAQC